MTGFLNLEEYIHSVLAQRTQLSLVWSVESIAPESDIKQDHEAQTESSFNEHFSIRVNK